MHNRMWEAFSCDSLNLAPEQVPIQLFSLIVRAVDKPNTLNLDEVIKVSDLIVNETTICKRLCLEMGLYALRIATDRNITFKQEGSFNYLISKGDRVSLKTMENRLREVIYSPKTNEELVKFINSFEGINLTTLNLKKSNLF